MIKKDIRDDIKLLIAFKDDHGELRNPAETPFEITLFNFGRENKREWKATYDGTTYSGCKVVSYDGILHPDWVGKMSP